MADYRNGVPVNHLEFRNGAEVERWLNCESPDTYPYRRRPTCDRIALGMALLDIVEEAAPKQKPHPYKSSAEELAAWELLDEAKKRIHGQG